MSYKTVADIQTSQTLQRRITACAASEGLLEPHQWVPSRMWFFAATPGWVEAWLDVKAQAADADPGNIETAITDAMIRERALAIYAAELAQIPQE